MLPVTLPISDCCAPGRKRLRLPGSTSAWKTFSLSRNRGVCLCNAFAGKYVPLQVDNPDQRIGEDISSFTQNCISVIVVLVGSVLKMASFVGVLLSISPNLTAFVVAYSLAGTVITTSFFGAQLKHFVFEGAKREANFRCRDVSHSRPIPGTQRCVLRLG